MNSNVFTWCQKPIWTHQQLHDVFGSSFSETQAVAERRLYIVAGWGGRARRYHTMHQQTLAHLSWTNSRAHLYHGRTNSGTGSGQMSTRRYRPRGPRWGPGGARPPPTSLATFPGIFSELTRYNFHVAGAAIVLSQSCVVKGWCWWILSTLTTRCTPTLLQQLSLVTIGGIWHDSSLWKSKFGNFIKWFLVTWSKQPIFLQMLSSSPKPNWFTKSGEQIMW